MHILVTGGTGFLGQYLVRSLFNQGHKIRVLGRNFAPLTTLLHQGVEAVEADLRNTAAVVDACESIEVVYHVGALSAPWGRRTDFFAINVGGTEAVIAGCRAHNVRRLIYVSSPSVVFSGRDIYNATEDAPYPHHFTSIYALTKKLGEDRVNAVRSTLETVILRPKAIFGPGDQSLLPRLIAAARQGRLPQIGTGRNLVDLTYVENVVLALLLALEAPNVVGKTYTITNLEHIPLWDVIRTVLQRLGLSTDLRRVPLVVVLGVSGIMEIQAMLTGKEPLLTRYSAAILARTQTYDITAAQRDLGYTPRISVSEGIERTLQALECEK